ncbi:MAG: PEP/pyruvate-binding domain-containing protein [Crocinitomicaceae bacterium]
MTTYPFDQLPNQNFGGKANSLSALFNNGFNVPKGFVIPSSEIEQVFISFSQNTEMPAEEKRVFADTCSSHFTPLIQDSWEEVKRFFPEKTKVAVRSSINVEDGTLFSFAGQFTTVLNVVDFDGFATAVLECIASTYSQVALAYCSNNSIDCNLLRVNLIVQEMVNPDHAGVCFTVNPITGNEKEIMIESINGLGENLVQGTATPSSYRVNWYDSIITQLNKIDISSLEAPSIDLIVSESLKIQQFYGYPVDIEWAIKAGKLYILQARPMTAIRFNTKYDWTNADLKDGGISSEIATPFMYALYERAFETTMPSYLKSVKLHPSYTPEKWFTQFMLYSYWNISAVKDGVKKIPGFVEREFDNDLGIEPHYEGKGHVTSTNLKSIANGIQVLAALKKSIRKKIGNAHTELARMEGILSKYRSVDVSELSDSELCTTTKTLVVDDFIRTEGAYFELIYTNSNNTTLFKEYLDKKNKSGKIDYLNLITGLQNISHLRPSYELWELSRLIRNSEHKAYFLENSAEIVCDTYKSDGPLPLREEIDAIIQRYSYKSEKELQILTPNWNQHPMQALTTLINFIEKQDAESIIAQNDKQHQVFQKELAKITSKKMRKEISKHRKLLWLREEYRDKSSQMYGIIQTFFYEVGERMLKRGIISELEDIFFLFPEQIVELCEGNTEYLETIRKNKIIHEGYRNFNRPNEIWVEQTTVAKKVRKSSKLLNGIACSRGLIEGEAFVAHSVADAEKMPEGMIMITKFTDPAWTVYFAKITGLITETGGMLSHGAIISREYGIPAILAVTDAIKLIKTGDKLRINGSEGWIEILN